MFLLQTKLRAVIQIRRIWANNFKKKYQDDCNFSKLNEKQYSNLNLYSCFIS